MELSTRHENEQELSQLKFSLREHSEDTHVSGGNDEIGYVLLFTENSLSPHDAKAATHPFINVVLRRSPPNHHIYHPTSPQPYDAFRTCITPDDRGLYRNLEFVSILPQHHATANAFSSFGEVLVLLPTSTRSSALKHPKRSPLWTYLAVRGPSGREEDTRRNRNVLTGPPSVFLGLTIRVRQLRGRDSCIGPPTNGSKVA